MPQPELYRPRILIVDDVPDNLHALVNILRDEYAITAATSGAKAVEIAQRVPMPEMILLDIKMPDMDGYAVVEHLKSNPATADIPVMFVTALDDNADVKRGLDLGVVDYLIKPVDPELLRLRLRIQFQLRRAYQRQGSDMTLQRFDAGQPPSVLIVDDDPDSVDLLTVVLKDDFRIVVASNGAKALEIVQGETAPDLVLLDVMMPGMSGYEVCRRIKAMPIGIQIPVLFISAGSDVDAKIKGFDIGGSDYITKPYDIEEVRVRVRNQMELTRLRRYLENLVTQRTSQLRISEEKYRTVADFTYDWEFWVGPDGRYLYVSPSCERLTGYSADAFLDDPDLLERIVDPEDHLIIERHLSAIPHASMHTCALEFRVVTKAGETRWMEHRCRPVLRGDGTYLGRRASNRDITDRKLVVQRLREESDRSRLYLEVAEVFIVVLDEAARIQLINRKGCEILGRNESELIGRSWPEFCEPAKREQGLDNICRLMADDAGAELKSEYGVISNTGELRYFEWRRAVLHDEQGKPYGVVNSGRDVTDERHSQQLIAAHQANLEDAVRERTADLSVSEARMRAIVTTMLDSVVHIDERGTILAVNRAVGTLFGYEESEMVGCNVSMLMPASTAAAHDGYLQRYAGTREARIIGNRREVEARHKNGNLFPVELAVSQIQEDAELSFIGVIRDLTEQKNGERTLKQALQAAKDAAAAKSNFLANMSHEIRTPLNAILGLSRIGIRDSGQRKIIEVFKRLSASGNHLLAVVNDILDFSKIEAGKFTIEQRPFALFSVIDTVQNFVATRAEEKGLKLTVSQASDLSDWVVGDSLRLTQILTNLLSNAIKFTERGLVVLRIARENDDVYFMVTDTGVGMTQAQVDRLFQPFEQGDASTTRTYGGTGLGLVISKNLTEMLGGDIEVDSRVGVGSCFMLRLPLPVVNAPEHQPDRRSLV
ncbi:MAG: PAS domain S-box protein, partial [Hylemonella sp.]|nr:PAS domain S-box protein [Hylemonella sp.]